jgi:hypothetical protein
MVDGRKRTPLMSRVYSEDTLIAPKSDNYLRDIHNHIPPLIRKIYPRITCDLYDELKKNDNFLTKTIILCEQCFLKFSNSYH